MKISRRCLVTSAMALAAGPALSFNGKKPLNLVVGYQAGGGTDVFARIVAEKLQHIIGNSVLVVNKPGATGAISASYVANSAPDGTTLLFTPGSFSYAQFVLGKSANKLAYDPIAEFSPVAHLADVPLFLVTHRSSGIHSIRDIVEVLKTKPLEYGTTGTGSVHHILGEKFNQLLPGKKMVHVPYKGVAPAVNDLVAGHIPLVSTSLDAVFPYLADGSVKLLATTGAKRSRFAPNTPTFKEQGFDLDVYTWYGVFAPKNTPPDVIQTINTHLNAILQDPVVMKKAETILGAETTHSRPADMDALNRKDYKSYQEIINRMDFR